MTWWIAAGIIIAVVWLLLPGPKNRITPLNERQQRMSDRLVELDAARIVLIEELGIEPTTGELWTVTPPRIEGE